MRLELPSLTMRCVLLDIDGTLLDSNDAHARTWVQAMRQHGVEVELEAVRASVGMGGDLLLARLAGLDHEKGLGKKIAGEHKRLFLAELPRLRPFPGVRDLLLRMKGGGLRLVVATSAGAGELVPLLEQANVADLVDHATTSSDAEVSKPAPDIIEAALAKGQAAPAEAIMLGDTPYDLEAATRAGVAMVAVRCGGWPFTERDGALAVYDDPAAILADYDRSPFARWRAAS